MLDDINQIKPFSSYGQADEDEARRKRMREASGSRLDEVIEGLAPTQMHESSPGVQMHENSPAVSIEKSMPTMHHGGVVPRTGIYKLKRGERVIPTRMAQRFMEARR
jgi:hypothetical protein